MLKGYSTDSISKTKQATSNINGAYYTKYMKYKTKYIKEKGLVGGVLGTKECPTTFGFIIERSVGYYLRNYKCVQH